MFDFHFQNLVCVYSPGDVEGNDRADRLAGKATTTSGLASQKILNVEELDAPSAGAKPRTSHHRSPGGERRGKRKHLTFIQRTREGHRELDEHGTVSKTALGKLLRDGVGFSECRDTILN